MANREDIMHHYDDEYHFFSTILGETMAYSCGVFPDNKNKCQQIDIDTAQRQKLDKIMDFAAIGPDTKSVVDYGCGWGSMIKHLGDKRPDIHSTGVTISPAQAKYCKQNYQHANIIEANIFDVLKQPHDKGEFLYDAAVSIGAFEHFASPADYKGGAHIAKYREFFKGVRNTVKGNLALQSIVTIQPFDKMSVEERKQSFKTWKYITKYIFPNSLTPPVGDIVESFSGLYYIDRQEINTVEYPQTLQHWGNKLELIKDKISQEQYDLYRKYFDLTQQYGGGRLTISRFSLSPIR